MKNKELITIRNNSEQIVWNITRGFIIGVISVPACLLQPLTWFFSDMTWKESYVQNFIVITILVSGEAFLEELFKK